MFDPKGEVALTEACSQLVREMAEGEWVSYQDFGDRIAKITGATWSLTELQSAILRVDKRMVRNREMSVRAYMKGFKRLTAEESYQYMLDRRGKTRRQAKWMVESARRASGLDELSAPERNHAGEIARIEMRIAEIEERRERKLNPFD